MVQEISDSLLIRIVPGDGYSESVGRDRCPEASGGRSGGHVHQSRTRQRDPFAPNRKAKVRDQQVKEERTVSGPGLRQLLASDLYRYAGKADSRAFWRCVISHPGFTYTFWLRLVTWASDKPFPVRILFPLLKLIKRHLSFKYGISIDRCAQIGPGLYIGHFGGIVVSGGCSIGRDCNISHGVTLGVANRGPRRGSRSSAIACTWGLALRSWGPCGSVRTLPSARTRLSPTMSRTTQSW